MITAQKYHDDIQGVLGTALNGVTQYTLRELRTTGIVLPHVAKNDMFSMVFQMPHRKQLGTALDGVHLHYIPIASATGTVEFEITWGWFNHGDVIPSTLPNTATNAVFSLVPGDQYKLKISNLVAPLAAPTSEGYSSILMVHCHRLTTPAGADWGSGEIAIAYMDAHFLTDRFGSANETTD